MQTLHSSTDSLRSIRVSLAFLLTGSVLIFTATVALRFYSALSADQQHRRDRAHQAILTRVDYLKTSQSFTACIAEAAQIPSESLFYSPAKTLQDQCQIALDTATINQAQKLAESGQLQAAITELQLVSIKNAAKVRQLTEEWSNRVLQTAESYYIAPDADLPKAIQVADSLMSTNPLYIKAQIKIRQWRTEWAINQQHFQSAQAALETSQPEVALQQVQQITHPYWRQQAVPIINAAYTKIAVLNQTQTEQLSKTESMSTDQPAGTEEPQSDVKTNTVKIPSELLLPITLTMLVLLRQRSTT